MSPIEQRSERNNSLIEEISRRGEDLIKKRKELVQAIDSSVESIIRTEIKKIDREIESLSNTLIVQSKRKYCRQMLSIDYSSQASLVTNHIFRHKQRCGAFLISGPQEFGQDWVLRRILTALDDELYDRSIYEFQLDSPSTSSDPDSIWARLGEDLDVTAREENELTAMIMEKLECQHIFLVFCYINRLQEQQLSLLIEQFWKPLVVRFEEEQRKRPKNASTNLLAFFIDYSGNTIHWKIPWNTPAESREDACLQLKQYPICLEILRQFQYEHLEKWAEEDGKEILGSKIDEDSTIIKKILDRCENGIPEKVARALLELHGYDYRGNLWTEI